MHWFCNLDNDAVELFISQEIPPVFSIVLRTKAVTGSDTLEVPDSRVCEVMANGVEKDEEKIVQVSCRGEGRQ